MSIVLADIRDDLATSHREVIEGLSSPGAAWTSAERIAIATEVRSALGNSDLAPWQAPSTVPGLISQDHLLPSAAVDAVWRITNHPGTLTNGWYLSVVEGFPSAEHYVELVGLVAALNAIERFGATLDIEPMALPEPGPGDPSGERAEASVTTHWVPTTSTPGANVLKALSAVPFAQELTRPLAEAQYVPADALLGDLSWSRGTLSRQQIELVAAQTSLNFECFY